ncbi:hypothetical protein BDR26DRAFT_857253 [Obelidium mucronatum]|nr:hypothetical protein BDR26DRAFT_857253 [Obelidium mucronatum]
MKLRDPVAPTLSVPEFEYALLHYTLILHLSQELTCSLSDATISTLILHILNLNRIGRRRMMHKGLSGADVSVEKMVEILEGFMELELLAAYCLGMKLYLSLNSSTGVLDDAAIDLFLVSHAVIHGAIRLGISHEFERSDVVKKFATGLVELLGRNDGQEIHESERGVAFETNKSELFDGVKKAIVDVIEGDRKVLEVGELDQIVKTRFEADNSTL